MIETIGAPPAPSDARVAGLPTLRGPLSAWLFERLPAPPHDLGAPPVPVEAADDDDLHLTLYCCYELHYRGVAGVDEDWEWEPSLLALRRRLEARFEAQLRAEVGPVDVSAGEVVERLWEVATTGGGPSLSTWLAEHATASRIDELSRLRSLYQLKEADPHTWAIPRLSGRAKAVMVAIQADEYGEGEAEAAHATLFADSLRCLGLDDRPNAYLDDAPAVTLASVNLISLFGLHRRLRGALVGHLALFEMTSSGPMARYSEALSAVGVPEAGRRFYEVHIEADRVHQRLAADGMVGGLMDDEPELAPDVLFGARALSLTEARVTAHILGCWSEGRSALRSPPRR